MRRIALLFLLPLAMALYTLGGFYSTVPDKIFVEKGETKYLQFAITDTSEGGTYEVEFDPPSCLKIEKKTLDLGYIAPNETRIFYVKIKSNCEYLEKMKTKISGGGQSKEYEILIIPFKEPKIDVSKSVIKYGTVNEVKMDISFEGDEVCIYGDFLGDFEKCSKNGIFYVNILGDSPGKKIMDILVKVKKGGFEYVVNKTISFYVVEEKPEIKLDKYYVEKEGSLKFDLCENCIICLQTEDLILDKNCGKEFNYKYIGEEDKVKISYSLLKETFGKWVQISSGVIYLDVKIKERKLDILFGGYNTEKGYAEVFIVNPTDEKIEDVFVSVEGRTRYFSYIDAHDYELVKIRTPGCHKMKVYYGNSTIEKEICFEVKGKFNFMPFILLAILVASIYFIKKVK